MLACLVLTKHSEIGNNPDGSVKFMAINNMDKVMLTDLVGYEIQKKKLVENTEAFVKGKKGQQCPLIR